MKKQPNKNTEAHIKNTKKQKPKKINTFTRQYQKTTEKQHNKITSYKSYKTFFL